MKFHHLFVALISLNLVMVVPTCQGEVMTATVYEAMLRGAMDSFDFVGMLTKTFGKIVMNPFMLSRALPMIQDHLPGIVGNMIVNTLETVIEMGKNLLAWIEPYDSQIEISERSLANSFLGRILRWDFINTLLRLMRVPRHCHSKAACEGGAYVLHRNKRVAGFLKAMRAHFVQISIHWPAVMNGLRGEVCHDVYPECSQSFIMARTRSGTKNPSKNTNKNKTSE